MATFGVGASASRKNVGPSVNMKSYQGASGKVYNDGVLVFDPTVNKIEQIQDDTFSANKGDITATVVVSLQSGKTRAIYTANKTNASASTKAWFTELISGNKTLTGGVKIGSDAVVNAQTVSVTETATLLRAQFDFSTDLGKDQAAFNTAGSKGTVNEGDGESITFAVPAA